MPSVLVPNLMESGCHLKTFAVILIKYHIVSECVSKTGREVPVFLTIYSTLTVYAAMSRVADPGIRIKSGQWIRIRIRNPAPDPDPGGLKRLTKVGKN